MVIVSGTKNKNMDYSLELLETELIRLQKIANSFDYTSTTSQVNYDVINNISDLEKTIALIKREKPIKIVYV